MVAGATVSPGHELGGGRGASVDGQDVCFLGNGGLDEAVFQGELGDGGGLLGNSQDLGSERGALRGGTNTPRGHWLPHLHQV